mmetsp:Transcript_36705/g.32916  ORF Transcript_36705/g.32916 Transcript_36705/m.32916 type:complete len:238 (+) Transcript_36705:721-1434(+)
MKTFIENGGNNNDNMIDAYFKLARRCDAIYFAFLCRGCYEMVEYNQILELASMLLDKCALMIEYTKLLYEKDTCKRIYAHLHKNISQYMYYLSQFFDSYPYVFRNIISEYSQLGGIIIENSKWFRTKEPLKSAIIVLRSALRSPYHNAEPYKPKKNWENTIYQMHKVGNEKFYNYFTEEKVQTLLNEFITEIFPRRAFISNASQEDLPELIEAETDKLLDEQNPLDNTLFNLSLACS